MMSCPSKLMDGWPESEGERTKKTCFLAGVHKTRFYFFCFCSLSSASGCPSALMDDPVRAKDKDHPVLRTKELTRFRFCDHEN